MRKLTLPILLLTAAAAFAEDAHTLVLAASRSGRIEAYDPYDLRLSGTIAVNHGVESISVSPDGHTVYIAQESSRTVGCCGLFSLNLENHDMCFFASKGMFAVPSPDGRFLFTQGSDGVEVFDAVSRSGLHDMRASGTYNLQPSPDGRWLIGITNSPKPSLDIFDLKMQSLERQLAVPAGPITGAWTEGKLQIINYKPPETLQLWTVTADYDKLGDPKVLQFPDLHGACNQPVLLMVAGASDRLFLAEAFGYKMDRRHACPGIRTGGIYAIDPASGSVERIAPTVQVNRMAASPDGHDLYVLEASGAAKKESVRLLRLDARSGNTLATATLEPDDWSLLCARIPNALTPHGYVRAGIGCSH
jgi:DNA-binding beta-propeller fold protein YncE